MSKRTEKLEALFEAALALESEAQQQTYLDRACPDPDLRREVESLLAAHRSPDSLLVPGSKATDARRSIAFTEQPGDCIGRYKLLQKLGEGGMGTVWMAEQEAPVRRKVALKIIKLGMDTREVIARFEAERQALAMMDHPNVAKFFDAGVTGDISKSEIGNRKSEIPSGRPYFVMELVPGIRLTDYCDQNKLTIRERLELFTKVCHAVQHAHQKGVIHRDLKPSNILVTLHDGVPVPKVIDFGIAKATGSRLTDKTLFTQLGAVLGTPAYMSPEQAELSGLDIDTRSDIYSLGVLLYQLLTGKPPFDPQELLAAGLEQMCRTIREKEPPTPSARLTTLKKEDLSTLAQRHSTDAPKLVNLVRGDLDWIVMKCLEKDRQRRYETASGLAADIQRHLSNEPVVARPPSAGYRLQKLVRRNKLAFAAGAAVAAALLIGVVASTWQAIRASRAEQVQSGLRAAADFARSNEVRLRVQSETARRSEERQRRRAQDAARRNEELAEFYRTTFRSLRPEIARGRDTTLLRAVLDETATRLYGELTNQPGTRLDIARSLARTYEKLGEYGRSEKMYRLALQQAEVLYGRTNPYTGFLMHDVAIELVAQGEDDPRRLDEAETILREILAIKFVADPVNRMDPALTLDTLATVQKKRGDLTNAITTWREALTAWHKEPGRTSELALIQFHLAENLTATKHYAEAAGFAEQALAHRRQHAPAGDDLDLAASLELVGYLAYQSGDRRRAAQHYTQGLNLRRAIYPRASREWHRALQWAGRAAQRGGDLVSAEQWMREDLSNCRQTPGSDSGRLSEAVDSLARVLAARRAADEGVPLTREMMMIERKKYATNTARLALALAGDAELLVAFGAFAEAETVAREAVQLPETNATSNPGRRALVRAALGWALSERAWAERAAHPKADSISTGFDRRARESEGLLQEALALRAQSGPAWLTADTQSRLGFAQVLTALTKPGVTEPGRATNWVEAESRLLRSQESLRSDGDVDLFFRRAALQRLARLYEAWDAVAPNVGQAAPAAEWSRKLQEFDNWISDSGGG